MSLDRLVRTYQGAILLYFRSRWHTSPEDAEDLSQQFFTALVSKDYLANIAVDQGRFRLYVKAALDNFIRMHHRSAHQLKRGGHAVRVPLDDVEPADGNTPETILLREWARTMFADALARCEAECGGRGQEQLFRLFVQRDIERPPGVDLSHAALAIRYGLTASQVNNTLYQLRVRMRALILQQVRDATSSEAEALAELRAVLGER